MAQLCSNMIRPAASGLASTHRADSAFGEPRCARGLRRSGFSLLELLIVMSIMAAMTAVGILQYGRSLTRYRVETAAARLIADLNVAQTQARTTSSSRTVKFDPDRAGYAVYTADELVADKPGTTVLLADEPYRVSMRVDGLVGQSIAFDGRGEGNQGCIIVLWNGKTEKAVIIEPGYGRAYVAGSNE